jgi:hypothetical protein
MACINWSSTFLNTNHRMPPDLTWLIVIKTGSLTPVPDQAPRRPGVLQPGRAPGVFATGEDPRAAPGGRPGQEESNNFPGGFRQNACNCAGDLDPHQARMAGRVRGAAGSAPSISLPGLPDIRIPAFPARETGHTRISGGIPDWLWRSRPRDRWDGGETNAEDRLFR